MHDLPRYKAWRSKDQNRHSVPSWVYPWSHLMTLLFALFVFLFSVALKDQKKINDFWKHMQNSMLNVGAWDVFGDPMKIDQANSTVNDSAVQLLPVSQDTNQDEVGDQLIQLVPEELRRLRRSYEQAFQGQSVSWNIHANEHYVVLSNQTNHIFNQEAWQLKEDCIDSLNSIANIQEDGLRGRTLKLRVIVGAREVLSDSEASLWQWGSARASALAQLMQVIAPLSKPILEVILAAESETSSRLEIWVGGRIKK